VAAVVAVAGVVGLVGALVPWVAGPLGSPVGGLVRRLGGQMVRSHVG
jgi:hypothetical protein